MFAHSHKNKDQKGFTLLEMVFVFIISSLMLVAIITIYDQYRRKVIIAKTLSNIELSGENISLIKDRYPCPAPLGVSISDANFGLEFLGCNVQAIVAAVPVGTCDQTIGFCVVRGNRDTNSKNDFDSSGNVSAGDSSDDLILIGGIPIKTIRDEVDAQGAEVEVRVDDLAYEKTLDGWGNKLTYAVSASLTGGGVLGKKEELSNGVITALDETGKPTAGINNNGHHVIISHGSDANGAFSSAGKLISPCGTAMDSDNCDADGSFVQALGYSVAANGDYYDDYVLFTRNIDNSIWVDLTYRNPSDPSDWLAKPGSIKNSTLGNIFVGTPESGKLPDEKLHIVSPPGETAVLRGNTNLRAKRICEAKTNVANGTLDDPTWCFEISAFTGNLPAMKCIPGEVMVGFKTIKQAGNPPSFKTEAICKTFQFPPAPLNCSCPAGEFINGMKGDGTILCSNGNECN